MLESFPYTDAPGIAILALSEIYPQINVISLA